MGVDRPALRLSPFPRLGFKESALKLRITKMLDRGCTWHAQKSTSLVQEGTEEQYWEAPDPWTSPPTQCQSDGMPLYTAYVYTNLYIHMRVDVCMYVHACRWAHAYLPTYLYIYTYIHKRGVHLFAYLFLRNLTDLLVQDSFWLRSHFELSFVYSCNHRTCNVNASPLERWTRNLPTWTPNP